MRVLRRGKRSYPKCRHEELFLPFSKTNFIKLRASFGVENAPGVIIAHKCLILEIKSLNFRRILPLGNYLPREG